MKKHYLALAAALFLSCADARADDVSADPSQAPKAFASIVPQLRARHGQITLDTDAIVLNLPPDLGYLNPEQTETLLRNVVRYPGKVQSLGAIIPTNVPIGSPPFWFTLIIYQESGRVDDDKAQALLEPHSLLERLHKENAARNETYKKHGFAMSSMDLGNWSMQPQYDRAAHTLMWGLEFTPHGKQEPVLNYYVSALGRRGVVTLSFAGKIEQLPMLESGAKALASAISFTPTNRYEDSGLVDKKSKYNLADVVAGDMRADNDAPDKGNGGISPIFIAILVVLLAALYNRVKPKAPSKPEL